MKNKKVLILVVSIILILSISIYISFFFKNDKETKLLNEIKNSYSEYVYLNGKIYDDTYKEVMTGKITLKLEKNDKIDIKTKYFKLEDLNYYVSYKDVKKTNNNIFLLDISNYQSKYQLTTTNNAILYNNTDEIEVEDSIILDSLIKYQDKYLIRYLNHDFYIDKQYVKEEKENNKTYKKTIPTLKIDNIKDTCLDTLCLNYPRFEELLSILKSKDIYTLKSDEYQNYLDNNLFLKDTKKIVALLYDRNLDNETSKLLKKYNINLINKKSATKKTKEYLVTDSFNESRVDNMLNLVDIVPNKNQKVPVLNYHFFYSHEQPNSCNETICISDKLFKEHIDYLIANDYDILTMSEYIDFLYGRINIKEKSVLITVDDGAFGTSDILPSILEEKKVHATLFLISSWWDIKNYQKSKYLEIYSHGHNLHHNDYCNDNGCGIKTLLLKKEQLLDDLDKSIKTVNSKKAFCYPFYSSNENVRKTVKEIGFQVAFGGGNKPSTINSNKYLLPRYVIYKNTTVEQLKKMLTNN